MFLQEQVVTALPLFLLEYCISHTLELIPSLYRFPSWDKELFAILEEKKKTFQDYAFMQGFTLATSSFRKEKTVLVLDCTRHGKKTCNQCKIVDEDQVKIGKKNTIWGLQISATFETYGSNIATGCFKRSTFTWISY